MRDTYVFLMREGCCFDMQFELALLITHRGRSFNSHWRTAIHPLQKTGYMYMFFTDIFLPLPNGNIPVLLSHHDAPPSSASTNKQKKAASDCQQPDGCKKFAIAEE
jgi:hypothetical protein